MISKREGENGGEEEEGFKGDTLLYSYLSLGCCVHTRGNIYMTYRNMMNNNQLNTV